MLRKKETEKAQGTEQKKKPKRNRITTSNKEFKKPQAGAPVRYDEKFIEKLIKYIDEYTNSTQVPIMKEFLLNYEKEIDFIDYDTLYYLRQNNERLFKATKRLLTKKEVMLEKGLMAGANNTGIIFILKQMGWKDNPEVNVQIQNTVEAKKEKFRRLSTEDLEKLDEILSSVDDE